MKISQKQMKLLAFAWLIFISILFFLPGSALPKDDWLSKIYFDKWVHFGFFALLLFLWRFYFPGESKYHHHLLAFAFCYGLSVELIQHFFIANRSFDVGDLIADMTGGVAGIWIWVKRYIKK
jgi:VanZ family protein